MSVRVGINGFGRIGRNFFRAATQRGADIDFVAVNDVGSLETMAHLLKYDSLLGILPQDIRADQERHQGRLRRAARALRARPEGAALGRARRRPRHRVDGHLHLPREGGHPPRRRRPARARLGPQRRRRRHLRLRRQPPGLRPQGAPGHLGRQLHHQLLRADGQGARRRLRHRAGPDDDGARLHRRPDARRRAAQGSPPGPRRGDQHRADQHRRRPLDQPRARGDEGPPRRLLAPRAGADRLDHRLQRDPRDRGHRRRHQRSVRQGRQVRPAQGHRPLHRGPDRVERHRHRPALVHLRLQADDEHGQAGQGVRLVRQRVGLLEPARRPDAPRRQEGEGELALRRRSR